VNNSSPQSRIQERLNAAEAEHGMRILYACESGSRAWGFASKDSDYDVRFLYVRPRDWYLSVNVERRRDVIEYPIVDDLDINGWDLRKALVLFRKSNPPLLEWLNSPIVYREQPHLVNELRTLAATYHSPAAMLYHYFSMARGNFREFLQGESVIRKKYLYVLRPILAIRWIERQASLPPVEFANLVAGTVDDEQLQSAIDALLVEKQAGMEKDRSPRIAPLSDFIAGEIARLEQVDFGSGPATDIEPLNEFFRRAIGEDW
jgi:uncharacterized protein